ncbi:odr-3 [Pristionchus pacificus]|uniref:Odr-3 n=1 Tax=Pristionchus pacificus TaxID=54126 RepID=A0A454XRU7_PRIPA|nr:odr-3 [Pristionchus pacificus]|eukprot:PDM80984.1 odr-3 [Pristionchus pacificus]
MGLCQSSSEVDKEQQQRNKEIEKQINSDKRSASSIVKLLLLGAGECGKSTVLKQMQILHSNGFTEEEVNEKRGIVFNNTVTSMCSILRAMDAVLHIQLENSELEPEKAMILKIQEKGEESEQMTPEKRDALLALWQDKGVKKAYEMRSEYQLIDSAALYVSPLHTSRSSMMRAIPSLSLQPNEYFPFSFLDNVQRIAEPGFRPTEQDILFSRVATTGVVEVKFKIKELDFRVFDVGGQRSERRKWIHCFDNVESIIFITAISEYDQVLFEDESTNRMIESMQLFNSICNSSWFLSTAMILFMNKKDLFMEKIKRVNITTAFPDYEGGQNYEEAVNFIKQKFAELNMNPDKKTIYMHETCATDTNQVQLVISSVIDTIIQKNLQKAGMM